MVSGSHNLRALTVKDPWATLIAIGAKQIETRSYRTRHRGLVALHSSKAFSSEDQALCFQEPVRSALERAGMRSPADLPRGAVIAVAEIVGCNQVPDGQGWEGSIPSEPERSFGFYSPGRWMWRLQGVHRLPEPVQCRGMLGLWQLPPEVLAAVSLQLAS